MLKPAMLYKEDVRNGNYQNDVICEIIFRFSRK